MTDDRKKAIGNGAMVVGALMLASSLFEELAGLQSWHELTVPHTLFTMLGHWIGAAIAIIGAYHGGSSSDGEGLGRIDKYVRAIPAVVLAAALAAGAAMLPGCAAARPPAGTYSAPVQKAFDADQAIKAITAASQTAINLNATSGRLHLSDRDTAYVRDFALTAGAALNAYGTDANELQIARDAYGALMRNLSVDARQHPELAAALLGVGVALNQVQ